MSVIEALNSRDPGEAGDHLPETAQGGQEEQRHAAYVVETFVKAVKGYRYYPADYPLHAEFQRDLLDSLQAYLAQYYSLLLQVNERTFAVDGHVVYSASDLKSSVPFLLYRDGVRQLLFVEGVEDREVLDLLEVLTHCDKADHLEDDLVTLLWEKELIHIEYLAVDDFLDDAADTLPENLEELRERLLSQAQHPQEAELWEGEATVADDTPSASLVESLIANSDIYRLTPQELQALQAEVETDRGPAGALAHAAVLLDLLALEEDRELLGLVVEAITELADHLLCAGEHHLAADLFARLSTIRAAYLPGDWRAPLLDAVLQSISHPQHLQEIGRYLKASDGDRLDDLKALLLLLPTSAVPPLIRLLGEIDDGKTRALLGDVLVRIGAGAEHLFAPFLDDPRSQFVQDLVKTLGRMGHENIVSYLAHAMQHRDALVRKTVVKAAAGISGEHAERLLIKALSDADENVRTQAAAHLGHRHTPTAFAALLRVVQDKHFDSRSPAEVRAFLDGVGVSGSNAALDILQKMLLRTSWFERRKVDAIRQHAAHALAMMGTPEAETLLRAGAGHKDISIRHACTQALKALHR